jgi:hypothetical protein
MQSFWYLVLVTILIVGNCSNMMEGREDYNVFNGDSLDNPIKGNPTHDSSYSIYKNNLPECRFAYVKLSSSPFPQTKKFIRYYIKNVTDRLGTKDIKIKVTQVLQNELPKNNEFDSLCPDAQQYNDYMIIRLERNKFNTRGRDYKILFQAENKYGSCTGEVHICIPTKYKGSCEISPTDVYHKSDYCWYDIDFDKRQKEALKNAIKINVKTERKEKQKETNHRHHEL